MTILSVLCTMYPVEKIAIRTMGSLDYAYIGEAGEALTDLMGLRLDIYNSPTGFLESRVLKIYTTTEGICLEIA